MAITYVANALGATNSTTSFSITLPTTQAGDILILEFAHRGTGNGTVGGTSVTTGGLTWTLKHSQLFGSSAFSGKTYWTRATGNHSGQTVTGSSLTNSCAAIVTQYRGALASGDPLAAATIVGEQNASGNETQAQITTTVDGAWVVLVVVNSPDLAVASQACTSPGTLTERAERLSTGGTDSSIAHASAEKATAGATGALTWAQTNAASGSWAYAIEPAAEAAPIVATPTTATLSFTEYAPTVSVTNNVMVTPGAVALSITELAPTVTASDHKTVTPSTAELAASLFAPSVSVGVRVIPTTAELSTTGLAPTVATTEHKTVVPSIAELVLSTFAPTIGIGVRVVPDTLSLTIETFAPSIVTTNNVTITPSIVELILNTFAPTVTNSSSGGELTSPSGQVSGSLWAA